MDVLSLGIQSFFYIFLTPVSISFEANNHPCVFFFFGCDWNIFEDIGSPNHPGTERLSGWWAIHLLGGRLVCLDERQDGWRLGERSEIDENWNVWIIMDNIHITYIYNIVRMDQFLDKLTFAIFFPAQLDVFGVYLRLFESFSVFARYSPGKHQPQTAIVMQNEPK